jgi:predicted small lipoprotein YifL
MRRTSLAVVAVAFLVALAGCGQEQKETPLELGDDSSSQASPSDDASTGGPTDAQAFDDEGHEALRGKVDAATPDEQAVADAWFAYWDARTRSYGEVEVDPDLGSVAASTAVSDVVGYVAYLRSKKLHMVGDTRFDVRDISVDGSSATLSSCARNKSIDVDAEGTPAEAPVPFFTADGTLVKRADSWRVVSVKVQKSPSAC